MRYEDLLMSISRRWIGSPVGSSFGVTGVGGMILRHAIQKMVNSLGRDERETSSVHREHNIKEYYMCRIEPYIICSDAIIPLKGEEKLTITSMLYTCKHHHQSKKN